MRSSYSAALAVLCLVSAALFAAACPGPVGDGPPSHVFLITVDTLRADHMGAYGYPRATSPALDALAEESLFFARPIAQWPKTGPSFASMFTGQYPQTTGLTHEAAIELPAAYLTLPELFAERGYETVAVVSNGVLSAELGWNQGFTEYLETWRTEGGTSPDPHVYRKTINAPRVNELARPLLERHQDAEKLFVWLHYSDPHAPYVLPDGVDNPFLDDPLYNDAPDVTVRLDYPAATALGDRRDLRYYVSQYDANVLVVDRAIEEILAYARRLGMMRDSVVVFTADHGESLGEHDYFFGHGRLPYNTTLHVPLFVHAPGRAAEGRIEEPVELVDLYPTLRDLIAPGDEVAGLEGATLLPYFDGEAPGAVAASPSAGSQVPAYAFAQAGGGSPLTHFRTVQDDAWKLVFHPERRGRRPRPASWDLYDLVEDPGETIDVKRTHPEQFRRLRRELNGWMKGSDWIRRGQGYVDRHSEETLKALRALGYIQ